MRALLVFKKPSRDNEGTLYRFERRDMGCFNGLNTTNAFTPRMCDSRTLNSNVAIIEYRSGRRPIFVPQTTDDAFNWQFMALGWITDFYADAAAAQRGNLPNDYAVSELVASETFSHDSSRRVLTTNERELKNLISSIEHIDFSAVVEHENMIFTILRINREFNNHMAMDLVGSERSSGLAVAYLQVFRNTSRNMSDIVGSNNSYQSQLRLMFRKGLVNSNGSPKIHYPGIVMSDLFNSGSDSDIFSFAGPVVYNQAKVHGLFSLAPFFRDTRPMVEEGRYNKGGQSETLEQNANSRYRYLHGSNYNGPSDSSVDSARSAACSISEMYDQITVANILTSGTSRVLERITQGLNSQHLRNLQQNVESLAALPQGWVNLNNTRQQQVVASSVAGFTQWISNNDTIETE